MENLPGEMDVGVVGRHVLVVDDEQDFRDIVELVLSALELEVTSVASGAAALAALRSRHYDLVITDLRMPGLSGADTITALRSVDASVPVVIATGCSLDEARASCARGARAFLRKPFNTSDLVRVVRRALGAARSA